MFGCIMLPLTSLTPELKMPGQDRQTQLNSAGEINHGLILFKGSW